MRLHQSIPFVFPASVSTLLSSNMFHLVDVSFSSPVPQALRLAWHTEAVPVVGEVAVNTQENREWISTHAPAFSRIQNLNCSKDRGANSQPCHKAAILKITT